MLPVGELKNDLGSPWRGPDSIMGWEGTPEFGWEAGFSASGAVFGPGVGVDTPEGVTGAPEATLRRGVTVNLLQIIR